MIIECTNCQARYQYGEERFDGKPSKKIRCAKCRTVFEIHNPASAPPPPSPPAGEEDVFDRTSVGRRKKLPEPVAEQQPAPESPATAPPELGMPAGKRLSIAILDGVGAGSVFRLEKPATTIGRAGDIVIEDTEASRQHVSIEIRDYYIVLNDLASTNGTMVNGEKITAPTELQDKSEFQIGSTTFMLIVTSDT